MKPVRVQVVYVVYVSPVAMSCRITASREAARERRLIRPCVVAYESALSSSPRLSNRGVGTEKHAEWFDWAIGLCVWS